MEEEAFWRLGFDSCEPAIFVWMYEMSGMYAQKIHRECTEEEEDDEDEDECGGEDERISESFVVLICVRSDE